MRKFLIVIVFFALHSRLFAQQFSQYNTGTLYESFENPSQKAFIPDSSRKIAFNFLIPNFNADITLSGNAQIALKNRAFLYTYNDKGLTIGKNNFNYAKVDVNAYFLMVRLYNSLNGDEEIGISGKTKFEGRTVFADESAQLLADNSKFINNLYNDLFAYRYKYQAYHEIGFTFRKDIDRQFSIGFKAGLLLGVVASEVNVNNSVLNIDRTEDRAFLSLRGNYKASFEPGLVYTAHDIIPSFKNPGASINIGATYLSDDKIKVQLNLKDLGFIHWNGQSFTGDFDNTGVLNSLRSHFEDTLGKVVSSLVQARNTQHSFTTYTNSRVEIAGSKSFWLDSWNVKYTPTVVLSKELLYTGFTGAWVNHFQYKNYIGTVTASYDDMKYADVGLQLMYKAPNAEFYIGTDRLIHSAYLASAANKSQSQLASGGNYTGGNFFLGFSLKFGGVIEHNNNSHLIPMGDNRSFLKRLWQRITNRTD